MIQLKVVITSEFCKELYGCLDFLTKPAPHRHRHLAAGTGADNPTSGQAAASANYQPGSPDCGDDQITLCGICFDAEQFPLNSSGQPDFTNNPRLDSMICANYQDPTKHGVVIQGLAPNNDPWVKLNFRPEQEASIR